jgi:hypothetical protein
MFFWMVDLLSANPPSKKLGHEPFERLARIVMISRAGPGSILINHQPRMNTDRHGLEAACELLDEGMIRAMMEFKG